jgi:beta-glucanase (GH16 family)
VLRTINVGFIKKGKQKMSKCTWRYATFALLTFFLGTGSALAAPSTSQVYHLVSSLNSSKCADSSGASADYLINDCSSSSATQDLMFVAVSGGYELVNQSTKLCMGVAGASTGYKVAIDQETCSASKSNQTWILNAYQSSYELQNANGSACLDLSGGSLTDGNNLQQYGCFSLGSNPGQIWNLVAVSAPPAPTATATPGQTIYQIESTINSAKCIDTSGADFAINDCASNKASQEIAAVAKSGGYELIDQSTQQCMGVAGDSSSYGALIDLETCTGASDQIWLLNASSGNYEISNSHGGTCLDLTGGSTTDGNKLQQYGCFEIGTNPNQMWKLVSISGGSTPTPTPTATPTPTPTPTPTSTKTGTVVSQTFTPATLTLMSGQSTKLSDGTQLLFTSSANLEVLSPSGAIEYQTSTSASCTANSSTCELIFQNDGNLVIYAGGNAIWSAATYNNNEGAMIFSNTAPYLEVLSGSSAVLWSTSPLPVSTPTPVPTPTAAPGGGTDINLTGYTMTFDDEFNSLSASNSSPKGSATWYEQAPNGSTGDFSDGPWNPAATTVANGVLSLAAYQTSGTWQSGYLNSVDTTGAGFSQKYGYFEIRAQMPASGTGAWPAFWLLGVADLQSGQPSEEVDVFEWYGTTFTDNDAIISEASHNWNGDGSQSGGMYEPYTPMPSGAFPWLGYHIYGVLITSSTMTWYIDGIQTNQTTTPTSQYMNSNFQLIINYAVGGGWPTTGMVNNTALDVDWVRVYSLPN